MSIDDSNLYPDIEHKRIRTRFQCDTGNLKKWLRTRSESLKDLRKPFEDLWVDIRDNLEPTSGRAIDSDKPDLKDGKRLDDLIKTSFARELVHRYADGMQSGVTNPTQNWFEFVQERNGDRVKESQQLKAWFDFITQQTARCMQRSNIYRVTREVYLHAGLFGTSCSLLLHGRDPGTVYLHLIDEGNYWIAENRFKRVDTLLRRMRITIAQAVEEFSLSSLPERWCDMYNRGRLEDMVTVWNMICPNVPESDLYRDVNRAAPFASFYWADDCGGDDNDGIIRISQYTYNPIIAYRQSHSFSSVYGIGIGEMSLPDVKQLYYLEIVKAKLMGNEVEPPLIAPSSMKGKAINEFPGGITYIDSISSIGGMPIQRLFQTGVNPQVVMIMLEDLQARVNRMWHGDLFGMMINISQGKKDMTAREVEELSGEKVALLGPVLTGMNDDFLSPLVDGIFTLLYEDGYLEDESHAIPEECMPDPNVPDSEPEVTIGTEFISTIHTAYTANLRMRGTMKLLDVVGLVAQADPQVIDKIDGDQIVDEIADVYRVTAPFVRTDEMVRDIRVNRERQAEAMQRQQQLSEMAKSAGTQAKALSETPVGNGSALDAIVSGQGMGMGMGGMQQ